MNVFYALCSGTTSQWQILGRNEGEWEGGRCLVESQTSVSVREGWCEQLLMVVRTTSTILITETHFKYNLHQTSQSLKFIHCCQVDKKMLKTSFIMKTKTNYKLTTFKRKKNKDLRLKSMKGNNKNKFFIIYWYIYYCELDRIW